MTGKPSRAEDEYFAREDVEKLYRLAREQDAHQAAKKRDTLKAAHWMKCPSCGHDLQSVRLTGVALARCFHCHGTWLGAGELEKLAGEGTPGLLASIVAALAPPGR